MRQFSEIHHKAGTTGTDSPTIPHVSAVQSIVMSSAGQKKEEGGRGGPGEQRLGPAMVIRGDVGVRDLMSEYRTGIAAGTSSCISTLTAFPLDAIKTRMQTYRFAGVIDCARQTYQSEGLAAFWRGSIAPLFSIAAVRTISMSTYTSTKSNLYEPLFKSICGTDQASNLPVGCRPFVWFLSGATAGAFITTIACPFEYAKLSTQIQILVEKEKAAEAGVKLVVYKPVGTIQSARNIVKSRGFMGLYTGFRFHLARDSLGTGLYFTIYETVKRVLTVGETTPQYAIAVAGGLCGLTSWAMVYPIDSIKSIVQRDSLMDKPSREVVTHKFNFFQGRMYRGLGISMLRSCVVNAIFFTTYEKIKGRLKVEEPMKI